MEKNKMGMTRAEHLAWCKERAFKCLEDKGEDEGVAVAWASFVSDMNKHDETKNHMALAMGIAFVKAGHINTKEKMKKFIEDFN